ncbi:hypothetical protein M8C13_29055 [Crossiella sp. SN42]|uniref:hypothetical protein n=1 Tax=Crossiella sp. SN42 TaxID=2944808 RepID=UPI00207CC7E8|nr:hypothetical protein [Crossiella sp. SN42]MCO1579808.1 hypothetical protein [Crossiella sp. SN42]
MSENNGRLAIALSAIGVVAAIISASTDLFGLLKDDPAPPAAPPATPSGQPAATAPASSTSAKPVPEPKEYAFVLDFGDNGVDLDTDPPDRKPDLNRFDIRDFYLQRSTVELTSVKISHRNVVQWTGSHSPTLQECTELLGAESVRSAKLHPDRKFCVRTVSGRIGLLTAVGPKGDGWAMTAKMWPP